MSAFKLKHNRSKQTVQINTLDDIHKNIVVSFQNKKYLLPEKEVELKNLQQQLNELELQSQYSNDEIKKRAEFKVEIKKLQDEIYDISNDLSELEYYSKTDDIIMDYYELADIDDQILYDMHPELSNEKIEAEHDNNVDKLDLLNKQNNNKQYAKKTIKRRKRKLDDEPQHTILDFLTGTANMATNTSASSVTEESEDMITTESSVNATETSVDTVEIPTDEPEKIKNKAELFDQYMMIVDNEYKCTRKRSHNIIRKCENCHIDTTLINSEGIFVCQQCGEVEQIIIDSEKPNYKEAVSDTKPGYPLIYGDQSIFMLVILLK